MPSSDPLQGLINQIRADLVARAAKLGRAADADEIVQRVLESVTRSPEAARKVREHANPAAYLMLLVTRATINSFRRNRSLATFQYGGPLNQLEANTALVERTAIAETIRLLKPLPARLVTLRLEGKTFQEIAEEVGCSKDDALKQTHEAIVELRRVAGLN